MSEKRPSRQRRLLAVLLGLVSFDRVLALLMSLSLTAAVTTPLAANAIEARNNDTNDVASEIQTSVGELAADDERFPAPPSIDGGPIEIALEAPGVDGDIEGGGGGDAVDAAAGSGGQPQTAGTEEGADSPALKSVPGSL